MAITFEVLNFLEKKNVTVSFAVDIHIERINEKKGKNTKKIY